VVGKVGNVDYKVEMTSGKVKTFHINMLKKHYQREATDDKKPNNSTRVQHQAAAIACALEDENDETNSTAVVKDSDVMPLYNAVQKESVDDVAINPELSTEQINEVKSLLKEYSDIFTDVPKITHLAKHKVDLTQKEPVQSKIYPTPYKMDEVTSNEIDDMLAKGITERSEAAYTSPLVLVKKPDGTYRTCLNFKEFNKITVFDPEPMMSADDIFPKLAGSRFYSTFDFCKGYWHIPMEENSKDCTTFVSSRGLFRLKVMPFGLVNAGSTYNRMVRKLLDGATSLQSYVDDVIGNTKNWDEHIQTLRISLSA